MPPDLNMSLRSLVGSGDAPLGDWTGKWDRLGSYPERVEYLNAYFSGLVEFLRLVPATEPDPLALAGFFVPQREKVRTAPQHDDEYDALARQFHESNPGLRAKRPTPPEPDMALIDTVSEAAPEPLDVEALAMALRPYGITGEGVGTVLFEYARILATRSEVSDAT